MLLEPVIKADHVVLQHNQDKVVLERKDLIRGGKLDDGLLSTGGLIMNHYNVIIMSRLCTLVPQDVQELP